MVSKDLQEIVAKLAGLGLEWKLRRPYDGLDVNGIEFIDEKRNLSGSISRSESGLRYDDKRSISYHNSPGLTISIGEVTREEGFYIGRTYPEFVDMVRYRTTLILGDVKSKTRRVYSEDYKFLRSYYDRILVPLLERDEKEQRERAEKKLELEGRLERRSLSKFLDK